ALTAAALGADFIQPPHFIMNSSRSEFSDSRPDCDLERRRRFLRLAAGGAFAAGLSGSALGRALVPQDGVGDEPTCTTTVTYTTESTSSDTHPGRESDAGTWTVPYTGTPTRFTGSRSEPYSGTGEKSFVTTEQGVSTFSGSWSITVDRPGGYSVSSWADNGTLTLSNSFDSYSVGTRRMSWTEDGTMTATCEDLAPGGPILRRIEIRDFDGRDPESPTLGAGEEILEPRHRSRKEFFLSGLIDEIERLDAEAAAKAFLP
ncbi:MAG: hypothetical protein AAGG01_21135, partial [Planctomycetota bacterium]